LENDDQCRDKCVPNCEKWIYQFEFATTSAASSQSLVDYFLSMATNDYLIMEETHTWTFEQFIGALGGALGIWLGLDFGILIEFFVNPILLLIRKLLSKKSN
jgi:hypothetical protein